MPKILLSELAEWSCDQIVIFFETFQLLYGDHIFIDADRQAIVTDLINLDL